MTTPDGNWRLGIGDPTAIGWVTVAAYFLAAGLCEAARRRQGRATPPAADATTGRRRFWLLMTVALLLLGVNKQLDLQTLLTDVGRSLAKSQGWYGRHGIVQQWLIGVLAAAGAIGLLATHFLVRRLGRAVQLALAGGVLLVCFVVIRAASFHHVDLFLGRTVVGVRMNWLLELGGITVIACGAAMALREARPARRNAE